MIIFIIIFFKDIFSSSSYCENTSFLFRDPLNSYNWRGIYILKKRMLW